MFPVYFSKFYGEFDDSRLVIEFFIFDMSDCIFMLIP